MLTSFNSEMMCSLTVINIVADIKLEWNALLVLALVVNSLEIPFLD